MEAFAKIFETEQTQILVKLDVDDEDRPEVRLYYIPPGLGVCSVAIGFKETDWDEAQKTFDKMDHKTASKVVDEVMKSFINQSTKKLEHEPHKGDQ